jgi:pimeloyl-ACP methyl ester carboxylesterase
VKDKITILCLSGWAQKPDSLEIIFKNLGADFQIISFDYSRFDSVEDFFVAIKKLSVTPQIIAGWSLGGQLAVRLIAKKILNPKILILLSAPFQFVKTPQITAAMPKSTYDQFKNNFAEAPDGTLKKFSILTMMNDKNSKEMFENLEINETNHHKLLFWLEELERFSAYDINFNNFPETLIIHGAGDVVVHQIQAKIFAEKIPNSKLEIINNCGHAPHFNNLEKLRSLINEKINSIYK